MRFVAEIKDPDTITRAAKNVTEHGGCLCQAPQTELPPLCSVLVAWLPVEGQVCDILS